MDARTAFSGTADGRFERIVHHLFGVENFVPEVFGADLLAGHFQGSPRRIVIARHPMEAQIPQLLDTAERAVEIVVVGGPGPTGREEPEADLLRWFVAEDGRVRGEVGDSRVGEVRRHLDDTDHPPDWVHFWGVIDARDAARKEVVRFQKAIQGRTARAAPALVVVIVAVYALGMMWGAPDYGPALSRMGAMDGGRVLQGEVWRLLSSTFLHGSLMHLGFNTFVLWSLGSFERVIGTARFLLIYAVAGVAGSLASMWLSTGFVVGASGAVWGLMTAQMVLAWRGQGILPTALIAPMKEASIKNLLINVGVSFLPGVGWAAHLGGGVLGAALAYGGAVTQGMPRWAAVAPGATAPPDVVPGWVRAGSVVSAFALVASLASALAFGRAWEAASAPVLGRAALGETGFTAELPEGLVAVGYVDGVAIGDVRTDPADLKVTVTPLATPPTAEERAATFAAYPDLLADATEAGFATSGAATRVEIDGVTVLEQRFVSDDVVLRRAVGVGDHAVVFADLRVWKRAEDGWETVAQRAAGTAARE